MSPAALSVANHAVIELAEYCRDLAASKRAQPGDDLYMAMVHAADNAGLDGDELIANAIISLRARISAQSSLTHAQAVPNRGAACAICLLALAKIEPAQVLPVASPMAKAKT